jgi:hypothetical protein
LHGAEPEYPAVQGFSVNELHRRLHQSHSYRLRIITIIFCPRTKVYILGADDFYVMTQFFKLTLPVKCPGGRFDPNQTCRNLATA